MIDPSRIDYLAKEAAHRLTMGRGDMPLAASAEEIMELIDAYTRERERVRGGPVENILRDAAIALERPPGFSSLVVAIVTDGRTMALSCTPFVASYGPAYADPLEGRARAIRDQATEINALVEATEGGACN